MAESPHKFTHSTGQGTSLIADQIHARLIAKSLGSILDDLPLAHDQLWLHLLPNARSAGLGSRQRHSVFSHGNVLNLDVVDLLSTTEKPVADLYRSDDAIEADKQGRRLGVLPTLSQWVRLIDERMTFADEPHSEPFALVTCGPVCRFNDQADEVALWPIYPGYSCTEIERTHWRRPTVVSHCRWLRLNSHYVSDQEWGVSVVDDLAALLRDIQQVTGMIEYDRTMPCLTVTCGNVAYPQKGGQWYRCSGCDRAWSRGELIRIAAHNAPRTVAECAKLLGISEKTIWRRVTDGSLVPIRGLKRGKSLMFNPKDVDAVTRSLRYRDTQDAVAS